MVPQFGAQLAGNADSIEEFATGPYIFEEKLDGIRALVTFQPDRTIQIRNRAGENKGRGLKNPWLIDALHEWARDVPQLWLGTVLDGELVADTWNQTMHELSIGGDGLRFVVFDLPFLFGQDIRRDPLSRRREMLDKLFESQPAASEKRIVLSPIFEYDPELVSTIWSVGGEGVIVKHRNSPYRSNDRRYWFKLKEVKTADAWIGGFKPGNGKYADTVGALRLYQLRNGKPVEVTTISGMDDAQRYAFTEQDIGRVVEFKYQLRTAESYRHPRWLRWRDDKIAEECTWEATE